MTSLLLLLAGQAGKLLAQALRAKGQNVAATIVTESEAGARAIIATLKSHVATATNGELTAADVQTAVMAAVTEVDALIAEAEASLQSRRLPGG